MVKRKSRRALLRSSTLVGILCFVLTAGEAAAQQTTYAFDIPAEPLATALHDFARISGQQIIFTPDQVAGKTAPALQGRYTADEALSHLFSGTNLIIDHSSTAGLMVQSKNVQAASNEGAATESVVVTGTHIRGENPIGSSAKTYTREEIDQSGAATVDQLSRLMPENFSGADQISSANGFSSANFASVAIGHAGDNTFGGSSFNIHGLGSTSTLTLLNGLRLAPAGIYGLLTDVSLIPLSAIDHIDVLTDGASAIYGADAVAGVVNIVTRTDFDGAQTNVRYGAATDGGVGEFTGSELLGKTWNTGNVLFNYEYDGQDGLDASQRSYIPSQGGAFSILPASHRNSLFLTGNQQLWKGASLSIQANYSDRGYSDHGTEFAPALHFSLSNAGAGHATQSGLAADLSAELFGDWMGNLTANHSRTAEASVTNSAYLLNGASILSTRNVDHTNADILDFEAVANGTLISLPAGPAKAAIGASFRTESFNQLASLTSAASTSTVSVPASDRHAFSVFGELSLPLIGAPNALPGAQKLELSIALRHDDYSDFGSTTNPKYGLLWEPVAGLDLRSTYGTSFRAPSLSQLYTQITSVAEPLPDASVPGGFANGLYITGGNPNLSAETSRSFTAGLDVRPELLPNLVITVNYFNVRFNRLISLPLGSQALSLSNPQFAPFITLNPNLALVQSYFNSAGFAGNTTIGHVGPAGIVAILNNQNANLALLQDSGMDFTATYAVPTEFGDFNLGLSGTELFEDTYRAIASSPSFALLNTFAEPVAWKLRGGLTWSLDGFQSALKVNYTGSYKNTQFTPSANIPSWTTLDLYLGYKFDGDAARPFLSNLTASVSVTNLLDQRPPTAIVAPGEFLPGVKPPPFDSANASPIGRVISFQLTKRLGF